MLSTAGNLDFWCLFWNLSSASKLLPVSWPLSFHWEVISTAVLVGLSALWLSGGPGPGIEAENEAAVSRDK